MDKDEYGSSGTFKGGKFTPFAGAAEKQEAAEKTAQSAEQEREERRKQLEAMTVEQLRSQFAALELPENAKKAELVEYILDEE